MFLATRRIKNESFSFFIRHCIGRLPYDAVFEFVHQQKVVSIIHAADVPPLFVSKDPSRALDIFSKLESGLVLNKKGGFPVLRIPEERKRDYITLYLSLRDFFHNELSSELHITHGTLLGAVRCGDFIEGDDDFDVLWVSSARSLREVISERAEVYEAISRRFLVRKGTTGHIKVKSKNVTLDVMPCWHDGSHLNISSFTSMSVCEGWAKSVDHALCGKVVTSLGCFEEFLEHQYGADWRVPDPSYRSRFNTKQKNHLEALRAW